MTAPAVKNVAAFKPAVSGGVLWAPLGAPLPTDATSALDTAFSALGYVDEEGIVPDRETSIEKIKSWEGDVIAALKTDDARSFAFKLVEYLRQAVNEWIYGAENVSVTPAAGASGTQISVLDKATEIPPCVLVFQMVYGGVEARVVVPHAAPVVTEENPFVAGGVAGYGVTAEALKDSDGNRVYTYFELDDAPGE